jgi:hypothetical protein
MSESLNLYFTSPNTSVTNDGRPWAEQWKDALKRITEFQRRWDEQLVASVAKFNAHQAQHPCGICGFVTFSTPDGRTIETCQHVLDALNEAVPIEDVSLGTTPPFTDKATGIAIHLHKAPSTRTPTMEHRG